LRAGTIRRAQRACEERRGASGPPQATEPGSGTDGIPDGGGAEGSKQTFQFQEWPETAVLLKKLGADTSLGIAGKVQERQRDIGKDAGKAQPQ